MTGLPDELVTALASSGRAPLALRLRQRDGRAIQEALALLPRAEARLEERLECIRTLGELREPGAWPAFLALATNDQPVAIRRAALAALGAFEDDSLAGPIVRALPQIPAEVQPAALALLTSRGPWSVALLSAMDAKQLPAGLVPPDMADRLRQSKDPRVHELAARVLAPPGAASSAGGSRARQAEIEAVLRRAPGNPYAGEALFNQRCAGCHKLFFKGGNVGPDLTAYQRDNLGTLLSSVLNPSAEIREGYAYVDVETKDGRTLGGFLTDRDAQVVVLRGLDGQDVTLRTGDIRAIEPAGRSLMPEGLLDGLSDDQLRDLFGYLRSSQPFTR